MGLKSGEEGFKTLVLYTSEQVSTKCNIIYLNKAVHVCVCVTFFKLEQSPAKNSENYAPPSATLFMEQSPTINQINKSANSDMFSVVEGNFWWPKETFGGRRPPGCQHGLEREPRSGLNF